MIVMMGPVGAGKGTQSDFLADEIGYTHLASGDLARSYANDEQRARMLKGEYLRDEEIMGLIEAALSKLPQANRIILDGIPRTMTQLDWLLRGADNGRWKIEAVFYLMVSPEVAWERMRKRGREDDSESAIAARTKFYKTETDPLLTSLRERGFPIYDIDGAQSPEEVKRAIALRVSGLRLQANA